MAITLTTLLSAGESLLTDYPTPPAIDVTVPALTIEAFLGDNVLTADVTLPAFTVFSGDDGIVADLPAFTVLAGADAIIADLPALAISSTAEQGGVGTVDVALAIFTTSITHAQGDYLEATLPAYEVSCTLTPGFFCDLTLPVFGCASRLEEGNVADVAVTLPGFQIIAHTGPVVDETLPAFEVAATCEVGNIGSVSSRLPMFQVVATAIQQGEATCDAQIPAYSCAATLAVGSAGQVSVTLPSLSCSALMLPGGVGSVSVTLPVFASSAYAYPQAIGAVEVELPAFYVEAFCDAEVTATFRGWALNLRNSALSEYTNFAFNSFAQFNGYDLAAGAGGICSLDGNTDNGTAITAKVRPGLSQLKADGLKRVVDAYVQYRSTGAMVLTVRSNDGMEYVYPIEPDEFNGLAKRRVKVGRGLKLNFWDFEISNDAGADFDLQALSVTPLPVSRNTGDAAPD